MTSTRLALLLIALGFPFAITHCSSSDSEPSVGSVGGNGGTTTGIDVVLPPGGGGGAEPDPGGLYNPLCGDFDLHDCNPDDPNACRDVEVTSSSSGTGANSSGTGGTRGTTTGGATSGGETPGTGGSFGLGGQAGAPGEAGAAGAAGEAGADDSAGGGSGGSVSDSSTGNGSTGGTGGSGSGDAGPDAGPLSPSGAACRVTAGADGPARACRLAGAGRDSDPCTRAADCAGGFACVREGDAGICRPYCCSVGQDPCASGSYCGERTLLGSELDVPVCVRADNCSLSQAYPCASGDECQCQSGTACLVVRRDGTTTCAVPGEGEAGEACPCAWGHVCSQASGTCLKLCDTVVNDDPPQCGDGICQAAANLPGSWGVCIQTDSGR